MKRKQKNNLIQIFLLAVFALSWGFLANAAEIDKSIILQTNQERVKAGLQELKESEFLDEAAKLKVQDMAGKNYFAHTSPEGTDPWHWLEEVGYQYKYAGENLAMNFSSASSAHRAWMKSQSHKENILSDHYTEIGVAVAEGMIDGKQTRLAVQFFGNPLSPDQGALSFEGEDSKEPIAIEEASIKPWSGGGNDEIIAYAKVLGNPNYVEIHYGGQKHALQKMGQDRYLSLLSIDGADLEKESVVVKAELGEGRAMFYQIPQEQYISYLKGADIIQEQEENARQQILGAQIEKSKLVNSQNVALVLFMVACMILAGNIWILEKEEERLLLACSAK